MEGAHVRCWEESKNLMKWQQISPPKPGSWDEAERRPGRQNKPGQVRPGTTMDVQGWFCHFSQDICPEISFT